MSESRKNKSIKRSRVAAAQIMRSAAEATVEPLEQRQLLSSVAINFTGGYSSGSNSVPPWSVASTANAGIRTGTAAGAVSHTIVGTQTNWNNEDGSSGSTTLGLLDNTGATTSANVTWSSGGTWASATNQPAQGDERLNTGFLNSGGTANPVSITVSNVPYAQYDVVVYTLNDAAGRVQTTTLNGYSLYGSSPNPITNAFAPQYLIDSDPTTPYYYSQITSGNASSPTSNGDFEVFSLQGTGTPGSTFVLNDVSPGNGYVNGIQIIQDSTLMAPTTPVENPTVPTISSVILNWQAVMGNVTYTVLRNPVGVTTAPTAIGTTAAGTTTFTDTTAVAGTTYNYWITATSPMGQVSAQSNPQQGAVNPFASPPAPTNLTAVANSSASTITLNWNASPNTTGYVIQRSTDGGKTWTTINPNGTQVTGTNFVDTTVTGGPAYLYQVGSINDAGNPNDLTNSSGNGTVNFSNTAGDGWNIAGTGDGLSGYYYNSITNGSENQTPFTGTPFGATVNPGGVFFSRVDGAVDYTGNNGDGVAPPNAPSDWKSISNVGDNFSVDWVGQIQPTATGTWTFQSSSDDGIEVDIEDLNGNWSRVDNNIRTYRGITLPPGDINTIPFQMIAGQKYNINVVMHEGGGGWGWILDWSGPGVSQQVVPTSALYSVPLDGSTPAFGTAANVPLPTNVAIPSMVNAAGGDSTATLTWHTLAADGYIVWRATETTANTAPPISAFTQIASLPGTGSSNYVDTTVTNGTNYWYFVTGYTQYGTGPQMLGPKPTQASLTQTKNQALVGTHAPLSFTVNGNPILPAESQLGYQPVSLTWGSSILNVEYHVYRNTTNSTVGAVELANFNNVPVSPTTGTSITDSTAQLGHSYYYYVVATNNFGTFAGLNSTNTTTPFVLVDLTHGLKASYYNDQWWHSLSHGINNSAPNDPLAVFGTAIGTFGPGRGISITGGPTPGMASVWSPEAVNFVPNLNINYNGNSPVNGIRSTYFSTVYSGQISLSSGVNYTFFTNSDDDSFVFVNGQIAAEDPFGHGFNGDFNTSNLEGTSVATTIITVPTTGNYPFFAAFSQGNGGSGIFVKWSTNGSATQFVPQSAFTLTNNLPTMPTPQTPDSGMALFRSYPNGSGGGDKTITGGLGQTPKVTFTFTNDNITNAISMLLERAEVNPSTGVTSGDWMIVATSPVPNPGTTATIIDTSAVASQTYSYRLVAANFDGIGAPGPALIKDPTVSGDPGTSQIVMTPPTANGLTDFGYPVTPGGENQGVEGHFYNDQFWGDPNQRNASTNSINDITNFGPTLFGTEGEWAFNNISQRGDENHPFPSGNTGPSAASQLQIDGRNSSVVFTGKIQINNPGTYTFYSNTDDDGYLFVNGQLVSADGGGHGTRNPSTVFPIVITQADINAANLNPMNIQTWSSTSKPLFNFQFFEAEGGGGWGTFMYESGPDTGNVLKLVDTGSLYSQSDPLTAPTINSAGTVSNNNQVSFNFTDTNTDELRYVLERSSTPDFSNATTTMLVNEVGIVSVPTSHAAGTWTGTTTTINDNAIPAGGTFYYRIRAENYDFVSPWAVVGGATPTAFTTANSMPAPTGLSILQDGNQIHLGWSGHNSPSSGINNPKTNEGSGYDIQRQVVGSTTWTDLGIQPVQASGYFDNINGGAGVTTPTAYVYQIQNVASTVNGVAVPASAFVTTGTLTMQPSPTSINIPTGGFGAVSGNFGYGSSGSGSYTTKISPEGYLQLTDGNNNESRSAFLGTGLQVNTSNGFKTTFDFTFTSGFTADGMTFLMQPNSNNSQNGTGGGLGAAFSPSVGVYFNLWNNVSQTGIEFNGNRLQSIDVPGNPFHSTNPSDTSRSDPMKVVLTYNAFKLTETIVDTVTNSTFSQIYTPLPIFGSMLHDNNVFVGFTAGTGGVNMTSQIRDWSFTANNVPAVQITGTTGNDTLTIKRDATNVNQVDYWLNVPTTGTPTGNMPTGTPYNISLLGGNDVLNLDNSLSNVVVGGSTLASTAAGNLVENVIGGTGNDTVNLDGANNQVTFGGNSLPLSAGTGTITAMTYTDGGGNDTITTTGTQAKTITATTGNDSITKNGTGALTLNAGTGKLALNAQAGTTTIPSATSGGIRHVAFSNITIGSTATVALANTGALGNYSNHANRTLAIVDAGGLNIASGGTLDMGDNSMLLKYLAANKAATDTMVNGLLASGFAGQAWNGTGINSSEASNDAFFGAAARSVGWADQFDVGVASFEGDSADVADGNEVMIKFTYYGDTDVDGKVAPSDSANFSTGVHLSSGNAYWEFGDMDYSGGKPTASDSQLFSTGLNAYKTFGQL